MDFAAIKKAAEGYRADMSRFLRDMIAIPSESCEEEGVVMCIKAEMEKLGYDKVEIDGLGNVIGWMGTGDKIIAIDSVCDSAGLGLLVYMAGKKYQEGASIEELEDYIESTKKNIAHWFVVDDLEHLKRGGRISAVAATFGKALQIKPIISCDETGKLANVGKIRGKSHVIDTLVKHLKRDGENLKKSTVFIGHANSPEVAKELKKAIKGICKEVQLCEIGPIIGSHVGSGMIAVVFPGKRNLQA